MTDYQIYKKIRPFIIKRILYAFIGLILIIGVIIAITLLGRKFPDYKTEIAILLGVLGIFIGWKIIRKGESRYRMAQVSVITDIVTGREYNEITSREAMKRVKSTFKYATVFGLFKNVWRHKNFKKAGQFITVMTANMIPYLGTCSLSWIFAHPSEERIKGACHAISNYYENRKSLRGKVIKAFLKEAGLVVLAFFVIFAIEWCIFWAITTYVADIDAILDKAEDFIDTIELLYDAYFESKKYNWNPIDVMTLIALYIAWFVKVFSIRAYQMIGIIRDYLRLGEENPPSDALYNKLVAEWEKTHTKKEDTDNKAEESAQESVAEATAETTTETTAGTDSESDDTVQSEREENIERAIADISREIANQDADQQ